MKIKEGTDLIARGWAVKPKGFRVRFQQLRDGKLVTEYSPPLADNPMDSDVNAWRYAWKLSMAADPGGEAVQEEHLVNITVVDDQETPVIFYATGRPEIFNPVQP